MFDFKTSNSKSDVSKSNSWKITSSWKLRYFRGSRYLQCFILSNQPLLITRYHVRFYANNYFEKLPIMSTAFKDAIFKTMPWLGLGDEPEPNHGFAYSEQGIDAYRSREFRAYVKHISQVRREFLLVHVVAIIPCYCLWLVSCLAGNCKANWYAFKQLYEIDPWLK